MPTVDVLINNRAYTVACDPGEETRVRALAAYVDDQIRTIPAGSASEAQLLALTAILLADQVSDLQNQLETERQKPGTALDGDGAAANSEAVRERLGTLAERIEAIAAQLEQA